jgi:hypothetical protein
MNVAAVRPGVVLNCGLLGVKTNGGLLRIPRVKTLFGGDMWVIRLLYPLELLACWDVPEKLGHLAGTSQGKEDIMRCMFAPIKIRQAALEDLAPVMSELMMSRGAAILKRVDKKGPEKRGPTLRITTPEEERSIFQDRSDPPLNSLIDGLKELSMDNAESNSTDAPVASSTVATKDDKAPVRTEKWDRMLCLGLPDEV